MHVKFERVIAIVSHNGPTHEFNIENGNVKGQGQRQGSKWKVIKVYMHVKFERDIIRRSFPTIYLNAVAKPNYWRTDRGIDERTDITIP